MPLLAELIVFYVAAAIKISLLRSCFSKACLCQPEYDVELASCALIALISFPAASP